MKKYEKYGVEAFIQDEAFRSWVLGKSCEELLWLKFIEDYPEKKGEIEEAERWIRASRITENNISKREIDFEVERFMKAASASLNPTVNATRPSKDHAGQRKMILGTWTGWAAACLVLAVGLASGWRILQGLPQIVSVGLVETTNHTGKPLPIVLEDSSVVILSANSSLRYPSQFSDTARKVYLKGEASFSVTHQGQPFLVYAGDMVTRVLGTRFVVNAFENRKKYTVQVMSGKVSVYQSSEENSDKSRSSKGLILTANQAAIYETQGHQLFKTLIADPKTIQQESAVLDRTYDEVPLPKLLKELEILYGITIIVDVPSFRKCRITATLSNESLYEQLAAICKTVSATYEIVDGQIVISGKGC